MNKGSKIFEGYRALGLYSSHIAHCTRYHKKHKEHYVFVPVGKVFHSYNCSKLGITQVSNAHPADITCIAADAYLVYTACGTIVRAFQHNRQVLYTYDEHKSDVHLILPFAEHLITVDKLSNVKIWDIKSQEVYLDMEFDNASFEITTILHPATYVNKILLGSKQGKMQLWNIRKNQMLYEFSNSGIASPILCLVQAPAVDVIAIGYSSGDICIHNIRVDCEIMKFHQDTGPVLGLAFRTDGASTLVSSSPQGNVAVWDLEEKRILGLMENVHSTAIAGMTFIHGQPLLITNAADNSIKMWAFDQSDGKGRLLRLRAGHSAPPTKIRFYDEEGKNILSVGLDSTMQSFSTEHESKNKSLGQASMNRAMARKKSIRFDEKKMPPIVNFTSQTARAGHWDNIIAYHNRSPIATTWNYQNCRMGSHKLLSKRFKNFTENTAKGQKIIKCNPYGKCYVTAVAMTECGNYCVIGYSTGHIDVYNMQSGLSRGTFIDQEATVEDAAHEKPVTGIAIDALNQITVSCSLDNKLKFWQFKSKKLMKMIHLEAPPAQINLQRGNSIICIALDNFSLLIYDIETRKLVRKFPGHHGAITDLTWSSDGRWLVSSAMDCTMKTWELPTDNLVDCFSVDTAAVTVSFSPTSELLASCHVDDLGIYLWSNRAIFTRVSLVPLLKDFHPLDTVELPATAVMGQEEEVEDADERDDMDLSGEAVYTSPEQIAEELITVSNLPSSRWANLLSLDVIKQRNKPKEPTVVPKSAPFFLPTVAGLNPTFAVDDDSERSKIVETSIVTPLSDFAKVLLNAEDEKDFSVIMSKLKTLGPSAIDIEIRCLSPEGGGNMELMCAFLSFIHHTLKRKKDFELVQAYLGLFLKVHAECIASDSKLTNLLRDIEKEHNQTWQEARKMLDQSRCLVNFIKNVTV